MSSAQEEHDRIEKYILGQLEIAEKEAFEVKLQASPELQVLVEDHKALLDAIEEQSLIENMEQIHQEAFVNSSASEGKKTYSLWNMNWVKYGIAASVSALVLWGGYTLLTTGEAGSRKQTTDQELFASYFTPDPGLPTTMSSTDNFTFFEAMVFYKQGAYANAIAQWEPLLDKKPENDTLNYFIGVAHLANNNENEAITFLQWATEKENSQFLSDAYYYLGLSYLKKGNQENAIRFFKRSEHKKSKELLSILSP